MELKEHIDRFKENEPKVDTFVNGDENTDVVPSGGGLPYPTQAKAVSKLVNVGGMIGAATLTALQAITPTYTNQIGLDESTGNLYRWNGTTWISTGKNYYQDSSKYTDTATGIIFTKDNPLIASTRLRLNKGISNLSLRGDHNERYISLAAFSYSGGVLSFILARPDSLTESMTAAANTKFVARFSGAVTFSGVQVLPLTAYGNTAAEISGSVTIDFDKLLQSDALTADYVANTRLFSAKDIIDLNGQYSELKTVKTDVANSKTKIDESTLIIGSDTNKNRMLNATIEELVLFKDLPTGYLNLAALFYSDSDADGILDTINLQIFQSADTSTKGTLFLIGSGKIKNKKARIDFDQGYAVVDLNNYVADNTGAAILGDNATYSTRGITRSKITTCLLNNVVFQRYENQFVNTDVFHLPFDIIGRAVRLYIKGDIAVTDYYLFGVFYWAIVSGKYRLIYQIRKMTSVTDPVTSGLIVYSGYVEFNNISDIKGRKTIEAVRINNHPLDAELDLDFNWLTYRADYNNTISPYFNNNATFTYETKGFDVEKLTTSSEDRFNAVGGLSKYKSLREAINLNEKEIFSVGGNLFKSTKEVFTQKNNLVCVNNPPKLLSRRTKEKYYDFYYNQVKVRLEIISADDDFYFVNSSAIIKCKHPFTQNLTEVANTAAAPLVMFDVQTNKYYSIVNYSQLFTNTALGVSSIFQCRLTYDEELFIIAVNGGNKCILITENSQTSLRTFDFNGSIGTVYTFGAGVNVVKDWCLSHYKDLMFVSDYDSGVGGIRGTTGGQKCYVSFDNGYTFQKSLDFSGDDWSNVINASNITSFNKAQAHIHAVTYDPKQDVAWIVTGDGATSLDNASFFWSRDKGLTWTQKRSTTVDAGAKSQMIMGLPFDGCVAFGSDDSSINGVGVITYDNENMVHEVIENYASKNVLLCFARSTWERTTSPVKYMSFGKDSQQTADPDAESFVIASTNGYTWERVWVDNNPKIYGNVFAYDDIKGNLFISLDGIDEFKERVIMIGVSYK